MQACIQLDLSNTYVPCSSAAARWPLMASPATPPTSNSKAGAARPGCCMGSLLKRTPKVNEAKTCKCTCPRLQDPMSGVVVGGEGVLALIMLALPYPDGPLRESDISHMHAAAEGLQMLTDVPHRTPSPTDRPRASKAAKAFAVDKTNRNPLRSPQYVNTCMQHDAILGSSKNLKSPQ